MYNGGRKPLDSEGGAKTTMSAMHQRPEKKKSTKERHLERRLQERKQGQRSCPKKGGEKKELRQKKHWVNSAVLVPREPPPKKPRETRPRPARGRNSPPHIRTLSQNARAPNLQSFARLNTAGKSRQRDQEKTAREKKVGGWTPKKERPEGRHTTSRERIFPQKNGVASGPDSGKKKRPIKVKSRASFWEITNLHKKRFRIVRRRPRSRNRRKKKGPREKKRAHTLRKKIQWKKTSRPPPHRREEGAQKGNRESGPPPLGPGA